ncbi:hypothetical protein Fcan01_24045 [Folsomia candida]|uniref:Transposase domain-containing protein n=1 Tax=Folsomia candida TaxID=158441 RepID=A0A226D6E4_FOLCA|nr:hypothetical protein Fcan01_24045 [Folsomia candida]
MQWMPTIDRSTPGLEYVLRPPEAGVRDFFWRPEYAEAGVRMAGRRPEYAEAGYANYSHMFVGSLFYGSQKPQNLDSFLDPFVDDMKILESGISLNSVVYTVVFKYIIADAPARSFNKYVKGHNAYFGCERCYRRGTWKKRVIYPIKPMPDLYNDMSFRQRIFDSHHKESPSPLEMLDFGMISQIPLDYMHLICLGVMKKLITVWTDGPRGHRLSPKQIKIISSRMLLYRASMPTEFARKPRELNELCHWKATEFSFLSIPFIPSIFIPHFSSRCTTQAKVGESGLGRGTGGSGRFGGGPGAGCRSRFGANNSSNNNNSNIADQLVNIACGRMPKFIFFRRIQYSGTFSTGRYPISVFVSVIFILKLRPPPSTSPQTARHALPTLLG